MTDEIDDLVAEDVTTGGPVVHDGGDQDTLDDAPELQPRTLLGKVKAKLVRTSKQAIDWAKGQRDKATTGWSGYCWRFARMAFNIDPLAPSAKDGWHMAGKAHQHRCSPADAPRGYVGIFSGGEYWHAVLTLGSGRCMSNDTRGDDQVHVARIEDIERAWGYEWLGVITKVNGELAPPGGLKPTSRPKPLTQRKWRQRHLRNAIAAAVKHGNMARAKRLRQWLRQLERTGR